MPKGVPNQKGPNARDYGILGRIAWRAIIGEPEAKGLLRALFDVGKVSIAAAIKMLKGLGKTK